MNYRVILKIQVTTHKIGTSDVLINVYKSDLQKRKKIGKKSLGVALTNFHGGNENSDGKEKRIKSKRGFTKMKCALN